MENRYLIERLRHFKNSNGYTLHELSRLIDIHVSTIERWFKTGRINRIYAKIMKDKLRI